MQQTCCYTCGTLPSAYKTTRCAFTRAPATRVCPRYAYVPPPTSLHTYLRSSASAAHSRAELRLERLLYTATGIPIEMTNVVAQPTLAFTPPHAACHYHRCCRRLLPHMPIRWVLCAVIRHLPPLPTRCLGRERTVACYPFTAAHRVDAYLWSRWKEATRAATRWFWYWTEEAYLLFISGR